jgi:hypothetical protein
MKGILCTEGASLSLGPLCCTVRLKSRGFSNRSLESFTGSLAQFVQPLIQADMTISIAYLKQNNVVFESGGLYQIRGGRIALQVSRRCQHAR